MHSDENEMQVPRQNESWPTIFGPGELGIVHQSPLHLGGPVPGVSGFVGQTTFVDHHPIQGAQHLQPYGVETSAANLSQMSPFGGGVRLSNPPIPGIPYLNLQHAYPAAHSSVQLTSPLPAAGARPEPVSFLPHGMEPSRTPSPGYESNDSQPLATVTEAAEDVMRHDEDDFLGVAESLRVLHSTILASAEEDEQVLLQEETHQLSLRRQFQPLAGLDPAGIFLSIQGAALRYHARWQQRLEERRRMESTKAELAAEGNAPKKEDAHSVANATSDAHSQKKDENSAAAVDGKANTRESDLETQWEEDEQAAWDVWEEAIGAASALAQVVGPAWRSQLRRRRQWISDGRTDLILRRGNNHGNQMHSDDNMSMSTVGMGSVAGAAWHAQQELLANLFGNPLSRMPSPESEEPEGTDSMGSNPQAGGKPIVSGSMQQIKYPIIPEVLPAAMLRFASSVSEMALPSLRSSSSPVSLNLDGSHGSKAEVDSGDPSYANIIGRTIWEEQRWLVRRQRVGNAQRDLVLSLCCDTIESNGGSTSRREVGEDESNADGMTVSSRNADGLAKWNIIGSHVPIASILASWVDTAKTGWPKERGSIRPPSGNEGVLLWSDIAEAGAVDWWYVLQVSRAAADLVAVGWRPPPRGVHGEQCVLGLLDISERGVILSSQDLKSEGGAVDQDAREERLAASSSSAEALTALALIGRRGHLPNLTLALITQQLCNLLASIDSTMSPISSSSLYPLGVPSSKTERKEWLLEKETFFTQRESCVADIAELLWSLLAHHFSQVSAVRSLLQFMDESLPSLAPLDNTEVANTEFVKGCKPLALAGAIRACGAAFWGDPPQVKGVKSLRIFWDRFLVILTDVASLVPCPREFHSMDASIKTNAHTLCICEHSQENLVVVLEAAVALRRMVDGEFHRGEHLLAPDEWEIFLDALEKIVPWLDCKLIVEHPDKCHDAPKRNKFLFRRIISEVRAIFDQTESCLTRGDIKSHFHAIVDDGLRKRLHKLMLRTACPLLQPAHAETIAIAVIRSWTWGGYYLNRGDIWYRIASDVLSEAFAVYDDESFGFGGYAHSPAVRLQAIRSITQQYGTEKKKNRKESSKSRIGLKSRTGTWDYTPAAMITNVNEMQVERLCPLLLPHVNESLGSSPLSDLRYTTYHVQIPAPSSIRVFSSGIATDDVASQDEVRQFAEKIILDEFNLRRCCVRILGRLFRILNSDQSVQVDVIRTLKAVAISFCSFQLPLRALKGPAGDGVRNHLDNVVTAELFKLSLEAIRQLEVSLAIPFGSHPLTHWCFAEIVQALCAVVTETYGKEPLQGQLQVEPASRKLLAFAALIPLARIRVNHDGRAIFSKRSAISTHIQDQLLDAITVHDQSEYTPPSPSKYLNFDEYANNQGLESEIAPFVFIDIPDDMNDCAICKGSDLSPRGDFHDSKSQCPRTGTVVSLDGVIATMLSVLNARLVQSIASFASTSSIGISSIEIDMAILTLCNNAFHELMLCGMPLTSRTLSSLNKEESSRDTHGRKARSRAAAALACHMGRSLVEDNTDSSSKKNPMESIEEFSKILLSFCEASEPVVVHNGCRGMIALLAVTMSASGIDPDESHGTPWTHDICRGLIDRLNSFIGNESSPGKPLRYPTEDAYEDEGASDTSIPLISTIFDIFTLTRNTSMCPSAPIRLRTILLCLQLGWNKGTGIQGKLLALLCAGSAIRGMSAIEAKVALSECNSILSRRREASKICQDAHETVIVDLLLRRYLSMRTVNRFDAEDSKASDYTAVFTTHEALAKETADMEQFSVEEDQRASAAWICGDTLLICRMGNSKSNYRGWIEMTVRSPTSRLRRLVRLPLHNNYAYPDLPSSLRSLTRSIKKAGTELEFAPAISSEPKQSGPTSEEKEDSWPRFEDKNSMALVEAEAALRRFDSYENMVSPDYVHPPDFRDRSHLESELNEKANLSAEQKDPMTQMQIELTEFLMKNNAMIITGSIQKDADLSEHPSNCRAVDSNALSSTHSPIPPHATSDVPSANAWLTSILGRSNANIERVEDELRLMGFQEALIGSVKGNEKRRQFSDKPEVLNHQFDKIQRLACGPKLDRAVGFLDRTASLQTHKIALLYAGPGSINVEEERTSEENILLRATQGSPGFIEFSLGLGNMVMTRHLKYYSGGLDTSEYVADGMFALAYVGDDDHCTGYDRSVTATTMVLFHSVPLMPPGTNNRKRHICNDVVHIIYHEKDEEPINGFGRYGKKGYEEVDDHDMDLSGEFGFITIVVSPVVDANMLRVTVKARADLDDETCKAVSHLLGATLLHKDVAAKFVNQLAVRADIACRSTATMQDRFGLVSNWEERLDQIRRIGRNSAIQK